MLHLTTPLAFNGAADRYHKNLVALRLLRELQAEQREPHTLTEEERLTLAHYTAFGDSELLRRAFGDHSFAALTSDDEQKAIKRTALTAFYTPIELLHVLWSVLGPACETQESLRILEPAFGIGMVVATMPAALRQRAQITAVELDAVSSQIAHYLHPDVTLYGGQGFEATELPYGHFDLIVTNVPFSEIKVFDPRMAHEGQHLVRTLHDYFIARSLKLIRPGGIVAVFTSYGTLDKRDERVRAWFAHHATLLAAIRLPQGFAHDNAGTECGTDLLLFQRPATDQEQSHVPDWVETQLCTYPIITDDTLHFTTGSRVGRDDGDDTIQVRINRHFVDHPDMLLGSMHMVRHNGQLWQAILPPSDVPLATAVARCLAALPPLVLHQAPVQVQPASSMVSNTARQTESPRVAGMRAIYTVAKQVLALDAIGHDATQARAALTTAYDRFTAVYGSIHTRANQQALRGEPELLFLRALETNIRQGSNGTVLADKTSLFTHPTIRPTSSAIPGSLTPDEGLLRSLDQKGYVNIEYISLLTGRTEAEGIQALASRIFRVPGTNHYQTADEYLSGNIRQKLSAAEAAASGEPTLAVNVEALTAVLPETLTPGQITVTLGAPWIPTDVVLDFIVSIIPAFRGSYHTRGKVTYHAPIARWVVDDAPYSRRTHEATTGWGTSRIHALELIEKGLNGQIPQVYDLLDDDSRVLNQKETLLAREQLERIKERFSIWAWEDADRSDRLCQLYNEQFNSSRRRDFNGAHLTLPGINASILRGGDLAPHQKDAVWMILQRQAVLLDLVVGAGKTFIMLAAAHELKRLGLAQKPLIAVPNHLVEQWSAEANRLYPDMRVLAMSPDDFSQKRRGEFLSRIATESWDLIICAHTSFGMIPTGTIEADFITREIETLRSYLTATNSKKDKTRADTRSLKEIEKKIAALEVKLKERQYGLKRDSTRVITWDELGIDALMVDESHEFKNLMVPTMMGHIPGVPHGDSKRSFDMRIKTWDLLRRGGRVVFATGTPILNTLGEAFIWQKYLQEEVLEAHGINHFDAWARTFAQVQTVFEMTPDGGGFRLNTRLCRFVNMPELFQLWFQFTFSRSTEQLGLPRPDLVTGKPIPVSIPGTSTLKSLVRSFVARVEAIKSGAVDPRDDNMLKITSEGRKAALDVRLVTGGAEEPQNKINMLVEHVAEIYHSYDAAKATQIIFCELSTPKPGSSQKRTLP